MNIIKEADFKAKLKSGLLGGYFFFGEEDYMKQYYICAARDEIIGEGGFAEFNDIKIYGEDFSSEKLSDMLAVPPMMSEKKLIELSGINLDSMKTNEFEELLEALSLLSEYDFNVLIFSVSADGFDAGYLPKAPSSKLVKLSEFLVPVQFDLMPPKKLSAWVKRHFAHENVAANDSTCDYLVDYCGRNMFTLKNEIEKLAAYVKSMGRDSLTCEDINEISVQGTEFGNFAFSNAIVQGDTKTALSLLALYKAQKKDPIMVMGEVSKTCSDMLFIKMLSEEGLTYKEISDTLKAQKVAEYKAELYARTLSRIPTEKLKRVIALCAEADLKLKNTRLGYVAIERLICSI